MRPVFALAICSIFTWAGCGPAVEGGNGGDDDDGSGPDARPGDDPASSERCQKMDILFVVDDSFSMEEEQDNLAANFPQFAQVLESYQVGDGLPLDYRIAVTTSGRDVDYVEVIPPLGPFPGTQVAMSEEGDDGAFRQDCGMSRRWIERGDADAAGTFACVAQVGTEGPGFEMQLHASELALSNRVADGTNAGFLRDDALLAVVYLTDEDDCSRHDNNFEVQADEPCTTEPPSQWVQFFDQLKGDRGRWATAVIAGPTDCSSEFGEAVAADRLQQFVQQTGENAVFSSICEGDLAGALQDALDTFQAACDGFPEID